jgi:hypothetical protein
MSFSKRTVLLALAVMSAAPFAAAYPRGGYRLGGYGISYGGGYGGYGGCGYGGYGGYGYGGYVGYGGYGGYGGYAGYSQDHCDTPSTYNNATTNYGTYGQGYQAYYNPPPRQYYTLWQYDAARACYSCYYQYLPTATSTAYNCHEVIYFAGDPYHYYYFNPYKRKFWGRAPVHQVAGSPRYSRLAPQDTREYIQQIPQSAFPTPGAMPMIPESSDNVAMTLPQGGSRLTPDVLANAQGNWRALLQDATGRTKQLDMTIKSDGNATMTQTSEGTLPSSMYCRYNFDDTNLKMAGDYGEFTFQIAGMTKDQLALQLNGTNLVFQRF